MIMFPGNGACTCEFSYMRDHGRCKADVPRGTLEIVGRFFLRATPHASKFAAVSCSIYLVENYG